MSEAQYMTDVDLAWTFLKPKFEKLIGRIKEYFEQQGFQVSKIEEKSDCEYQLAILIHPNKVEDPEHSDNDSLMLELTLVESLEAGDGTEGVNVQFECYSVVDGVCKEHGRICPNNFTPEVWVNPRSERELEERFKILDEVEICWETYQVIKATQKP